jgi:hypothetical protein
MQDKDCVDAIQRLAKIISGFAHADTTPIKKPLLHTPLRAQAAMAAAKNDRVDAN